MKNYTFTADESATELARSELALQDKSLQQGFREWIDQLARSYRVRKHDEFLERMGHLDLERMPTREERNAR